MGKFYAVLLLLISFNLAGLAQADIAGDQTLSLSNTVKVSGMASYSEEQCTISFTNKLIRYQGNPKDLTLIHLNEGII